MRRNSAGVWSRACRAHGVAGRTARGRVKCWPNCAGSIASATRASARTSSAASERERRAAAAARAPPSVLIAPVALALLELARQLDPLRELAQVGARGVAGAACAGGRVARNLARVGVEALHGPAHRGAVGRDFEHRALVIGGRILPFDRAVAALIVHYFADAAALGLGRRLGRDGFFLIWSVHGLWY